MLSYQLLLFLPSINFFFSQLFLCSVYIYVVGWGWLSPPSRVMSAFGCQARGGSLAGGWGAGGGAGTNHTQKTF